MTDERIEQRASDFAQAEYDRLIALGWSRRDAARHARQAQTMERGRLLGQRYEQHDEEPS